MVKAYIGLGSNLDKPREHVSRALLELRDIPHTRLSLHSSLYASSPLGPADQPDYINAVAELETALEPHDLLDQLQALENTHQRVRLQHWGPRTLDLDLLLYGDSIIDTERLQVPHPWMHERDFVLMPLAEIAAELSLPDGRTVKELALNCGDNALRALPSESNFQ